MGVELQVLAAAVLLAGLQLLPVSILSNLELGPAKTLGPRDEPLELSPVPARLHRAYGNHLEGLALFAAATVAVTGAAASSAFTEGCALLYLVARVVYVPLYAAGVPVWRSVVWTIGFAATLLMALAALI